MTPCGNKAMDINTDLSCSRNTDPDMALSSNSGPDITWPGWQVAAQTTQISMALVVGGMALEHQHGYVACGGNMGHRHPQLW